MTRKEDEYGRTRRSEYENEYAEASPDDLPMWPGKRSGTRHLGVVARKADGDGDLAAATGDLLAAAAGSSGSPLPDDLRTRLESSLASDLSAVRVHTGGPSGVAARAVGAVAYATGQDIHFGDGAYQPGSTSGDALIAHEVAHTVQQHGTTAEVRQDKLEVSSPGDAHEVEAEAFAQSFVAGNAASVTPVSAGSVSRAVVSRKDDKADKDKEWAKSVRPKVQSVMDATLAAQGVLNADATKACDALDDVQGIFSAYEKEYNEAAERFEANIRKAKEHDKEIRENIKLGFEVALVAGGAMGGVAGEIAEVGEQVAKINHVGEAANKLINVEVEAPEHKVPPSADVDWKGALKAAIASYRAYIGQNQTMLGIQNACNDALKTVATAESGDKKNVKESDAGLKAQKVADGAQAAVAQLASIKAGMLSTEALKFQRAAVGLKGKESKELEKDIALKWIAEVVKPPPVGKVVPATDNEEISSAIDYLKKIGVIGAGGGSLGVDTGWMTTYWDLQLIEMRAQVEQQAKEMVGKWVENAGEGAINSDSGGWNATFVGVSPVDTRVRVVSYSIAPLTESEKSSMKHNWSDSGARMKAEAFCRAKVKLTVQGQLANQGTVQGALGASGTVNAAE